MKKHWLWSLLVLSCGGRPAGWEAPFSPGEPVGLDSAVVVMDPALNRALVLTSPGGLELKVSPLPVGQAVTKVQASPDGKRLFVLSRGVSPRRNPDDERPRLTLIDSDPKANPSAKVTRTYQFNDPFSGLVLDPKNEWAVLYVTSDDNRPVANPKLILLVDLVHLDREPIPITVQSASGTPQSFSFTDTLTVLEGESRRLLVVETQNEVTLIDLADSLSAEQRASRQATIRMPENQQGAKGRPGAVVFHDANGDQALDSELAVSLLDDSNVLLIDLARHAEGSDLPFHIEINLVDVGGQPTTIQFVNTDAGVLLAALVGSSATLVDPKTSSVINVNLEKTFTGITLVTDDLSPGTTTDIALLWSSSTPTVALWNLGLATTAAKHGLETLEVGANIRDVLDVPGDAFPTSKILEGVNGDFYVLDLKEQQSSPMDTNGRQYQLRFAPDGQSNRLWAFAPNGTDLSSLDLSTLNPTALQTESPIWGVFDIAQSSGGNGRAAIVLHRVEGDLGATVLDALDPDNAKTRFYSGLSYGGLIDE